MKITIFCALIVIQMLTSGCFSTALKLGEIAGPSSTSEKVAAATLDVVTSPIQAPVLIPMYVEGQAKKSKTKKYEQESNRLMEQLENDPGVGIREKWFELDEQHQQVLKKSFSNPKVKYSDESLEIVYQQANPSYRHYIFRSGVCSREFIVRHFDDEYEHCVKTDDINSFWWILCNPNTPTELVQKVSLSQVAPIRIVSEANYILRTRQTERAEEHHPKQGAINPNAH